MKTLILLLTLSAGFVHAETVSAICGKLIPCGSYQAVDSYGGHPVTRTYSFTALGPNTVQFELAAIDNGVRTATQEIMTFGADGFLTIERDGKTVGTGVCQENACSISTPPFLYKGEQGEQALVFRFTATTMQLAKLYVDNKGGALHTNAIFTKVP